MNKKVLFITYYWPPSGGAGVQRTLKFVRYLPEFGIDPIVVTVHPDKASYPVLDESLLNEIPTSAKVVKTSSFEPLKYLAKIAGKEKVPYGGFTNTSGDSFAQKALRWIRGNFFIPDARVGWVMHATKAALKIIREEKIDTVFISSPPHSSQLIGFQIRQEFPKIRWIADLRDPWTKIYYYPDLLHTKLAKRADRALERRVLKQCDHAIVVSDPIRKEYAALGSVDAGKISVIPNGYDEENFQSIEQSQPKKFIISYTGTLAESYNPASLIQLLSDFVLNHGDVKLRFVGTQAPAIRKMLEEKKLIPYCEFIPYVPHQAAIQYMQESSVNLLLIPDSAGAAGILTGKLFEYLGSAKPILGVGPVTGDASRIVEECNAGKFFSRDQPDGMLLWLEEHYVRWSNGVDLRNESKVHQRYTRRELAARLADLLRSDKVE